MRSAFLSRGRVSRPFVIPRSAGDVGIRFLAVQSTAPPPTMLNKNVRKPGNDGRMISAPTMMDENVGYRP